MRSFVRAGRVEQELRRAAQQRKLDAARAHAESLRRKAKQSFFATTGRIAPAGGQTLTQAEERWVVERAAAVEKEANAAADDGNDGGGAPAALDGEEGPAPGAPAGAAAAGAAEAGAAEAGASSGAAAATSRASDGPGSSSPTTGGTAKGKHSKMFMWLTDADGEMGLDTASDTDSEIEEAEQRQRKMLSIAQRESSVPWFVPYKAHADTQAEGTNTPPPQQHMAQTEIERPFVVRSSSSLAASEILDFDDLSGTPDEEAPDEDDNVTDKMREAVRMRMKDLHSKIQFRPQLSPRSHMLSRTVKKKMQMFNGRLVTHNVRATAKGLIAQESLLYEHQSVDVYLKARRRYFARRAKKSAKRASVAFAKYSTDVEMARRRQRSRSEVRRVRSKLNRIASRRIAAESHKKRSAKQRKLKRERLRRERRAAGDVGVSSDSSDCEGPADGADTHTSVLPNERPLSPLITYQSKQTFDLARSFATAAEYSRITRQHGSGVRDACSDAVFGAHTIGARERKLARRQYAVKLQAVFRGHIGRMYACACAWFAANEFLLSRLPRKFIDATRELRVKFCSDSILNMMEFTLLQRKAAARGLDAPGATGKSRPSPGPYGKQGSRAHTAMRGTSW